MTRALGEAVRTDRAEHVMRGAQVLARVHAAALAAQPFPVEQMPARELRRGGACVRGARSTRGTRRRRRRRRSAARGHGPRSPAASRCASPGVRSESHSSAVLDERLIAGSRCRLGQLGDDELAESRRGRGARTPPARHREPPRSDRCRCRAPPSRRSRHRPSCRARARSPSCTMRSISSDATASWPRHAASSISPYPTAELPIACAITRSSSTRTATSVRFPEASRLLAKKLSANCSCTSAPASRATRTWREASSCRRRRPTARARSARSPACPSTRASGRGPRQGASAPARSPARARARARPPRSPP